MQTPSIECLHVFVLSAYARPKFRQIEKPADCGHMPDGSSVKVNEHGQVVYIEYGNGVQMRREGDSTLVRLQDGTYMMGRSGELWFTLD
ncbi:MAG TPA: hypothetical protein V6D17_08015 [Candidatus Obscuribacterales bacterium]